MTDKKKNNLTKKRFVYDGSTYKLYTPYTVISEDPPISEGPFYVLATDPLCGIGYLPDASYLLGLTDVPTSLNAIELNP